MGCLDREFLEKNLVLFVALDAHSIIVVKLFFEKGLHTPIYGRNIIKSFLRTSLLFNCLLQVYTSVKTDSSKI
jgi:tyrosine-protein phosphatase YwqE